MSLWWRCRESVAINLAADARETRTFKQFPRENVPVHRLQRRRNAKTNRDTLKAALGVLVSGCRLRRPWRAKRETKICTLPARAAGCISPRKRLGAATTTRAADFRPSAEIRGRRGRPTYFRLLLACAESYAAIPAEHPKINPARTFNPQGC
jgi:hypothetical protein